MRVAILLFAFPLAACAPTPPVADAGAEAALVSELAGLTPGKPSVCLPETARTQTQTKAYGRTLVFAVNRGLKYRNDTDGGCERAGDRAFLVFRNTIGQLCSGDIARTVEPVTGVDVGGCVLGKFTAYRRP